MHTKFVVPGVKAEDVWQLFNCSNLPYYEMKVDSLRKRNCDFCRIDREKNRVYFSTDHWTVMENLIAPRSDASGQDHQFVIPCHRHIWSFSELFPDEIADLLRAIQRIDRMFGITGGVLVIRSGDHSKNARSMPHLHVNYHIPTGLKRVEITIAKSQADLESKIPVLQVFEKIRLLREKGESDVLSQLEPAEVELVKGKIGKLGAC